MKKINKKKEIDKDDLGYQEEINEEGFTEEPIVGTVIKTFSFDNPPN
ncbi:MAG: hypothetical protein ACRC7N_16790 [Clostridium sp.]